MTEEQGGEQATRLDAERTRDELAAAVDELERRLAPKELLESAKLTVRRRPVAVIGSALGVAGAIAGAIVLGRRRG